MAHTTKLGLVKPAAGDASGTWGDLINTQLTDMLEEAIAGYVSIAITGDTTLTTNTTGTSCQSRHAIIRLTSGTLGSNSNIIVPDLAKMWVINNATTGGQTVTVKTANDAGVVVPNGKTAILYCDGADVKEAGTSTAGNATMGGTLDVTGAVTMASTLGVTGNVAVNTNKFTVAGSDGNTAIAGTLAVTGVTTATGGITGSPTVSVSASGNKDATAMTALVGQRIISTASGDTTYTLPDAATVAIPVGSTWVIVNAHATADITIESGGTDDVIALCSGAAYTPGDASTDRTIVQGGVAEIVCVAANLYVIFGGGVS
tara:strand:+ start:14560 stop:15507 length:948 start_codon:yes stop_codon:yes gene_type:complete